MTRSRAKQKRSAMYLETSDRRSLFLTALRGKLLFHEEAARKDPAVRVSLSSDSLFKQPGDHGDPHPPVNRRAVEARASEQQSDTVSLFQ